MTKAQTANKIVIRNLKEQELDAADKLVRNAFATFIGIPEEKFCPGEDQAIHYWVEPEGAFGAFEGDDLAGVLFVTTWGKFGFFGPLCICPKHWNKGVAQKLLDECDKYFAQKGTRATGLYTFSQSAKHIHLYEKYGYAPQYLTANLEKDLRSTQTKNAERSGRLELLSALSPDEQARALAEMDALSDTVFSGLSLASEARNSIPSGNRSGKFISETLLVYKEQKLNSFAICPIPPTSIEQEKKSVYAKFALARYDSNGENFADLLSELEEYASRQKISKIKANTNTSRKQCYKQMLAAGYRAQSYGIAMLRPDEPAFNRDGVFVIDDWR